MKSTHARIIENVLLSHDSFCLSSFCFVHHRLWVPCHTEIALASRKALSSVPDSLSNMISLNKYNRFKTLILHMQSKRTCAMNTMWQVMTRVSPWTVLCSVPTECCAPMCWSPTLQVGSAFVHLQAKMVMAGISYCTQHGLHVLCIPKICFLDDIRSGDHFVPKYIWNWQVLQQNI